MGRRGCVPRLLLMVVALFVVASGSLLLLAMLQKLFPATDSLHSQEIGVGRFLKVPLRALHDFPNQVQELQLQQEQRQQRQQQQQQQQQTDCTRSWGTRRWVNGLPTLYIITPTYPRAEQLPEITRTAQTLLNVPNVIWLVAEDAEKPTKELTQYLNESALNTVYMRVQMPSKFLKHQRKPRGVANRMAGINWIRENAKEGVFYFADDDNTYDIRLFEEIRWTKRVSMFPVGLVTVLGVSTPIVRDGKVVAFYDGWIAHRKFPVDMAGFAVSVPFLLENPKASMPFKVGYEEDGFLQSLGIKPTEIEPLVFNCTKIWVWHTQTKKNNPAKPVVQNNITMGSNLDVLQHLLWKAPGSIEGEKKEDGKEKEKEKKADKKKKQ